MKIDQCEYLIIGHNLTGILLAKSLFQAGKKVLLVESGYNPDVATWTGLAESVWSLDQCYFSEQGQNRDNLEFLHRLCGLPLTQNKLTDRPLSFEDQQWKEFVGFGELTFQTAPDFLHYTGVPFSIVAEDWSKWIKQTLMELEQAEVFQPHQYVMKLDGSVEQVVTASLANGKKISAEQFVLCETPKNLLALFNPSALDSKLVTKLGKAKLATSLALVIKHKDIFDARPGIHILHSFTSNEIEPVAGIFFLDEMERLTSLWQTFVVDSEADEEAIGTSLRQIKKLIKRAYPKILENVSEQIIVRPDSAGSINLKVSEDFRLTKNSNLWLGAPGLNAQPALNGCLSHARTLLSSWLHVANPEFVSVEPSVST